DPLRDSVAARRDRRRGSPDLQEPERARPERAQDLRDLVPDALAAGERRRRRAPADHQGASARRVRGGVRAALRRRGLQDRPLPRRRRARRAERARPRARARRREMAAPMTQALDERLGAELDRLREAGTYKRFNTLRSPQGPVVEMEGRGEVLVLSSNNYLGLADRPEVVEARIEGLPRDGA